MTTQNSQYTLFQQLTSARVVSTANVAASYLNGPLNNGVGATLTPASPAALIIDGVTLQLNDRVLLVGQTNANENGIYVLTSLNWVLTRVADPLTALDNLGIKRGTTAAYAGGGTSNAFVATGLLATDIVVATILASTNSVAITKAVPTANTLTVTFSADPGAATTVQWHAIATV